MGMSETEAIVADDRQGEIERLYHEAFDRFGAVALWNCRRHEHPTAGDALAITYALRTYAGMPGRRLAERLEAAANAAH
jgi:hypothetical protein